MRTSEPKLQLSGFLRRFPDTGGGELLPRPADFPDRHREQAGQLRGFPGGVEEFPVHPLPGNSVKPGEFGDGEPFALAGGGDDLCENAEGVVVEVEQEIEEPGEIGRVVLFRERFRLLLFLTGDVLVIGEVGGPLRRTPARRGRGPCGIRFRCRGGRRPRIRTTARIDRIFPSTPAPVPY